jgi:hypothetical protein
MYFVSSSSKASLDPLPRSSGGVRLGTFLLTFATSVSQMSLQVFHTVTVKAPSAINDSSEVLLSYWSLLLS